MQKRPPKAAPRTVAAAPKRPKLPNRQLPTQTRKVLAKHYRAKYGVR